MNTILAKPRATLVWSMAAYALVYNPRSVIQMPTLFLTLQQARLLGSLDESALAE